MNMKKTKFDELVSTVLNEEYSMEDIADIEEPAGDMEMDSEFDEMGEGGEDFTVSLTSDQIDCLRDILAQVDGEGEEEFDEEPIDDEGFDSESDDYATLDDEEEASLRDNRQRVSEMSHDGKPQKQSEESGKKLASHGANKVKGKVRPGSSSSSNGESLGGHDGKPSQLGDDKGKRLTQPGNNKVEGKVKPGEMFK